MSGIKNYRKKPVVIQALQYTGKNSGEVYDFSEGKAAINDGVDFMTVSTMAGVMRVEVGDFLIKGVAGEFYPCAAHIFDATYEVET
jgi:hypothetical protein